MALITFGVLKEDQYTKADLYNPPWDLLAKYDGESLILNRNQDETEDKESEDKEENIKNDDNNSVKSAYSEKSIEL